MATQTTPSAYETQPTPEFDARCMQALQNWRKGNLSSEEVVKIFNAMHDEAVATHHYANQGRAQHLLGYTSHYLGKLPTSIMHYEKARRLFSLVDNQNYVAKMDLNQGENYRFRGEFSRARRMYRAAYENARKIGNEARIVQTMAIVNEGLVLIAMGDNEMARAALHEGYRLSEALKDEPNDFLASIRSEIHSGYAKVDMLSGDLESAWDNACLSQVYADQTQEQIEIGIAQRIKGEVMTALMKAKHPQATDNPDDYFRAAMFAFREVDAEAEIARTIFAQARSLAARGKRVPAAKMFREAMVAFTRLGMTDDAAKAAEAQLRVL